MLSKQQLEVLKQENPQAIVELIATTQADSDLLRILKHLGRLPEDFEGDCLLPLTTHSRSDIRYWAIKNLGKIGSVRYLDVFFEVATQDEDSSVRREAVSSIGRLRSARAIPQLKALLNDPDPKVVLQAVRGLLIFKDDPDVRALLERTLQKHPNEMIRMVYDKEFESASKADAASHPHPYVRKRVANVALLADVQEVLPLIPDDTIHLTFTSPPYYNARDYSIYKSYEAYLDFLTAIFAQVHRITKEGRFFILNTSPVIVPRISRQYASKRFAIPFDLHARLIDIGWEFIDDIVWVKPEASVKNRNAGFLQHRKPLAYKPNPVTEYLMVYRKQTTHLIDWNIRQYPSEVVEASKVDGEYFSANVWHIDPTADKVHPAVFPYALCANVIRYYSFVGDVVFDPFAGSGTLGEAAYELGRHYFLVEQQETYFNRLQQRLNNQHMFNTSPQHFFYSLDEYREWASVSLKL
ncbi:MAG: restriction endonuclease subunit M [Phototrophicales bacterium]|nr:MAG: restriction endonuclease subunit M [Phototrophicales bacterium]